MDYPKNACRLCLKLTGEENLTPLFKNYGDAENVPFEWRRMFSFIYDIQGLPDKICNNGKAQAEWILNFNRQCYENDAILRFNRIKIVQPEFPEQDKANIPSSDQFHGTQVCEYEAKDFEKYEDDKIQQIVTEEADPEIIDTGNSYSNDQENIAEESIAFFQGDESKTFEEIDYSNKELDNYDESAISRESSTTKSSYICPICGKYFMAHSSMNRHRKKHDNPKPFKCIFPGCERKFSGKKMRDDHMKTIHEKYTYKCPACNHKRKYRVDVVKHILKLHKGSGLQPIELKS